MKFLYKRLLLSLTVVLLAGCNFSGSEDTGTLRVLLTDAPANAESVFVDIREVRIHRSSDAQDGDSGWVTIQNEPLIVDLLELTNGNYEVLGEAELETGRYTQLRFILGDQNEMVIDGERIPLNTPSTQQSGLKLLLNTDIVSGQTYTLLLDFDASKSIVKAGQSGIYNLIPVIRIARLEESGSIQGNYESLDAVPWVFAIAGSDTLRSTLADAETGEFLLIGLTPGSYNLVAVPSNDDYSKVTITGVQVQTSDTTDVGTIQF